MNKIAVMSFIAFTGVVALISWLKTRKEKLDTSDGYFLGGRSLGWFMVGGSIFLTNMSANNFIGENESVFIDNMSVMAWGMTSIIAIIIISEFVLPIYLRSGVVTTPDFLEERFDPAIKKWITIVFLVGYVINLMPPVLYAGAVTFNGMFDLSTLFGMSNWATIWVLVWCIGIVGSVYAIFGGLKAIAVSDAVNGVGLVVGGLLVPYFGLRYIGDGSLGAGLDLVLTQNTDHLNAIGSKDDPVPFSTLFTGMLLVNLNYFGTEQYIMQRALGSKDLSGGQKGMMFASSLKFISPLLLNLPALIALHLYTTMDNTAEVYSKIISDVMPTYLSGFMAAIIFGAALTTFNSGLNSTSTLFVLNIYKPYKVKRQGKIEDIKLIKTSKWFQVLLALTAMCIAPFIAFADGGFFEYIQKVAGFFSVPIFTILFVGFVTKKVPPIGAKVALVFFIVCYGLTQLVFDTGLHFLHIMAILFVLSSAIMLLFGKLYPMDVAYKQADRAVVEMKPWRWRTLWYAVFILLIIGFYVLLSPLGIAT